MFFKNPAYRTARKATTSPTIQVSAESMIDCEEEVGVRSICLLTLLCPVLELSSRPVPLFLPAAASAGTEI